MAKFITTTAISYNIESLIKDSKCYIILVAPYIKIHLRLRKIIERKLLDCQKGTLFTFFVVCKKNELKSDELRWLESQNKIQIIHCGNLHAKCYLNEKMALLTSMNLFEYSAVNNIEFGFLVEKEKDNADYREIYQECLSLIPDSNETKNKLPKIYDMRLLTEKDLDEFAKSL